MFRLDFLRSRQLELPSGCTVPLNVGIAAAQAAATGVAAAASKVTSQSSPVPHTSVANSTVAPFGAIKNTSRSEDQVCVNSISTVTAVIKEFNGAPATSTGASVTTPKPGPIGKPGASVPEIVPPGAGRDTGSVLAVQGIV